MGKHDSCCILVNSCIYFAENLLDLVILQSKYVGVGTFLELMILCSFGTGEKYGRCKTKR